MASTSLHLGSDPLDQIDSGRFSEARISVQQMPNLSAIDLIVSAEISLYFGDLAQAETALSGIGAVANEIEVAARYALEDGELFYARQDYCAAQKKFNAAYYFCEFLKDRFGSALALYRNTRILSALGQQDEAIDMLHEAYEGLRGQGPKAEFLRGLIDFQLAVCERRRGREDESEQLYQSAIDTLKDSERGRYYAQVLVSYGAVERERGNLAKAQEHFEDAMNLLNRLNLYVDLAACLCELSTVLISLRSHDRAERLLVECLDLYQRIENKDGEARALILLTRLELERNRVRKAREYAGRAYELAELVRDPMVSACTRIQLARSVSLEKERSQAITLLQEAIQMADKFDLMNIKIEALIYLADSYHGFDPVKGPEHIEAATQLLNEHNNVVLAAALQRVSQKYQTGRIWREGTKLIFDSNLLPNWYEAKRSLEVFLLKSALDQAGQNLTEAGRLLGISKVHVHDKRKQYQI